MTALEQSAVVKDDCSIADAVDAATRQQDRLRALGELELQRQQAREIDAALLRMQAGNYGVSEDTEGPIGFERLSIVPWARR